MPNPAARARFSLAAAAILVACQAPIVAQTDEFRVLPYLQDPAPDSISVLWFSETAVSGTLVVGGVGSFVSVPTVATALDYSDAEITYVHGDTNFGDIHAGLAPGTAPSVPNRHAVRVTGLRPDSTYTYTVSQGGSVFSAELSTAPETGARATVSFAAFADSETEPESTRRQVAWSASAAQVGGNKLETDPSTYDRLYPVDQTAGFKATIAHVAQLQPDLLLIAGDLVEKGGRQLDWDEFWRHLAGEWSTVAGWVPVIPALGNHENYWHPDAGAYSPEAVARAHGKWASYWETPSNGSGDPSHEGRYYRVDFGPVTIITLDSSNGDDSDASRDTNLMIDGRASSVPDFNPGSEQYLWAVSELADAEAGGQVIFVQFHHMAYGTGVHSLVSGTAGSANDEDDQSGRAMRVYHDLFVRYGVTAVFSGHDEVLEYVQLDGVHYWDVGYSGDGLRGPGYAPRTLYVPFDLLPAEAQATHWSAHGDVPEVWNGDQLEGGGKHYGFLYVEVRPAGEHDYEVVMTPRYSFPLTDENGVATGEFDFRQYPHVVRVDVVREQP